MPALSWLANLGFAGSEVVEEPPSSLALDGTFSLSATATGNFSLSESLTGTWETSD